ncbi:caspase, EACC1-associated type [Streptomyces sp. CA-111067]|uniref:caspase family protein n=1 Tax=Streptomyces sp. CA-111067 TaxID=3240046 RepID=UPI003D959419
MTVRLPDARGSRAVLIGTSRYDSGDLPDLLAVRNNLEVLQELLTADSSGGFPAQRCTMVQDAADPRSVCGTIREAALTATDTLLVYFCGHGILNEDLKELHLALTATDENDLRWTSIPFQAVREIFEASPCPNKILILDCCNSGQVLDSLMGFQAEPRDTLRIRGTHILTSSARDLPSYAPVGGRYTAFTGELIRLLRDGLPDKPELLTLSDLYGPLCAALTDGGYPEPRQQGSDGHAQLGLVRNRAANTQAEAKAPDRASAEGQRPGSGRPRGTETRFEPNSAFYWVRTLCIGLPSFVALFVVADLTLPMPIGQWNLGDPLQAVGLAVGLILLIVLNVLGKRTPADYSLMLSSDGIELQYGDSAHFSYPWHRISRCWLRCRPATRLRGPRYDLMVRPMAGTFVQTASPRTPGPRQEDANNTLRFADLRRLKTTPEAVEAALAAYAGTAWTPSPDIAVRQAPDRDAEQVFTADRRLLAVLAVVCVALGCIHFPVSAVVHPAEFWLALLPLADCVLLSGTAWFAASRLLRPVRLVIGAAGLTLTRGALEISYAWSEIERIGMVNWPRGARRLGLLAVQPTSSAQGRTDRTNALLPKLTPRSLTLCLLPEVTHDPSRLEAALALFADEEQLTLPSEAWLRPTAMAPAPPTTGVTFRGRQPHNVSAIVGLALFAPVPICAYLGAQYVRAGWLSVLTSQLAVPFFIYTLCVYFLSGRHHVRFQVGPSGISFSAFGAQRIRIPWGDVDCIGLVARSDPQEHALVLWSRPNVAVPRSVWLPFPRRHGGRLLLTLERFRIEATPEHLDQVIARYAGRRHTPMALSRRTPPKRKK